MTMLPCLSLLKIVESAAKILELKPSLLNVDSSFLKNHNIKEWMDLPLWLESDFYTDSNAKIKKRLSISSYCF
ncbi:MAG: hypothetical protein ACI8ZN_002677 [Bacteroidia bacterium]|jgi:hypothetical protein